MDPALLRGEGLVAFGQGEVPLVAHRVVRDHALLEVGGVFEGDDARGLVRAVFHEVLVLADPGVGDLAGGVVHHRVALVVRDGQLPGLEAEGAVLEAAQGEAEELVDPPGVNHAAGGLVELGAMREIITGGPHLDAFQEGVDQGAVAALRDPLVSVVEVVVVVLEAEREPLDDRGRELPAAPVPLLLRVALDQLLVDGAADQKEGLLLEVMGLFDPLYGHLLGDLRPGLLGRRDAPELAEGVHVERQVVDLAAVVGQRRVDERIHRRVLLDEGPDVLVGRVEDVGPVVVEDDPVLDVGGDVAARAAPALDDEDPLPGVGEQARHRGAGKAASDNQIIIMHGLIIGHSQKKTTMKKGTPPSSFLIFWGRKEEEGTRKSQRDQLKFWCKKTK